MIKLTHRPKIIYYCIFMYSCQRTMQLQNLPELLTLRQTCNILSCHPNTLRLWDRNGELKALRIGTRMDRRYKKEDVLRLLGFEPGNSILPKAPSEVTDRMAPKVVDLFCGCGGLSYGLAIAGYDVVLGLDNWEDAVATFRKNHPGAKGLVANLGNENAQSLCETAGVAPGTIDLVVGGPPCQGFSIAGKRRSDDPRNQLYKSFVEFVAYLKPKAFILENVPNLISMDGGSIKERIIRDFSDLGYQTVYKILTASDFGVPQNRRRVVFVGLKNTRPFDFPAPTHGTTDRPRITTKDALSDLPDYSLDEGSPYLTSPKTDFQMMVRRNSPGVYNHTATIHTKDTIRIISMVPDGGNFKNLPKELWSTRKVNIAWTRMNSRRPSFTIDTGHNHHFHYEYNRVPTTRESARLQSFNDDFIFLGNKTSQLKQVGNAVPPLLAEKIGRQLINFLN